MEKRFIGPQELAQYLGLSLETVRAWTWQRKIPFHKFGRLVKFDLREIESWAQENRVEKIS
jgi:excisionase family DNA binding protein